jgi:hypothetical protein
MVDVSSLGNRAHSPSGEPVLLVSVGVAAKMLGIGKTLCWKLVNSGELKSVPIKRRVLVPVKAIYEYIDRLMGEAG